MGAVVDVEIAEQDTLDSEEWLHGWAGPATRPRVDPEAPGITVDCAVCGKTHHPGTDSDPGCRS